MIVGSIRFKLGVIPMVMSIFFAPAIASEYVSFNDKYVVPFINYINSIDDDNDDNNDFMSDSDIVVSPVVVPGGTIYNPLSPARTAFDIFDSCFDEFLFRFLLFRSLWYYHYRQQYHYHHKS